MRDFDSYLESCRRVDAAAAAADADGKNAAGARHGRPVRRTPRQIAGAAAVSVNVLTFTGMHRMFIDLTGLSPLFVAAATGIVIVGSSPAIGRILTGRRVGFVPAMIVCFATASNVAVVAGELAGAAAGL